MDLSERHSATRHVAKFFSYQHLPPHLQAVSAECYILASRMVDELPDSPELSAGLRHLLEAKDCFVRAAVEKSLDADA
jgi:hypothetical protein